MTKKILVTGGAGYVGSILCPELISLGYDVTVYDNLMWGGNSLLPLFRHNNFKFIRADVRDKEKLRNALKDKDIIIHLAAIVGYPACFREPELAKSVNVNATKHLAGLVSKEQLVLYGSTGSNYGFVEEICTEETPLKPVSLYGETKTEAEKILLNDCTTIAYRFATAFGVSPRMRLDLLINDFVYKAKSQGYIVVYESHFMRTFIHVYDMTRAFIFAIENAEKMKGEVYNIGSDRMNYSKLDICNIIKDKIDFFLHLEEFAEDEDRRNYIVSYEKISSIGYDTTITIQDGIREIMNGLTALKEEDPYRNVPHIG